MMLAWVLRNPMQAAIAALAAAFLLAAAVQSWRLSAAQDRVTALEARVTTLTAERDLLAGANAQLAESLERQSAQMRVIFDQAEQAQRISAAALAVARQQTERATTLADRLTTIGTPTADMDDCARTFLVIDTYMQERRR